MLSGYLQAKKFVAESFGWKSIGDVPGPPDSKWRFMELESLVRKPSPCYLAQLEQGRSRIFKLPHRRCGKRHRNWENVRPMAVWAIEVIFAVLVVVAACKPALPKVEQLEESLREGPVSATLQVLGPYAFILAVFLLAVQADPWLARCEGLWLARRFFKIVVNFVSGLVVFVLVMPCVWLHLRFVNPSFVEGGKARRVETG